MFCAVRVKNHLQQRKRKQGEESPHRIRELHNQKDQEEEEVREDRRRKMERHLEKLLIVVNDSSAPAMKLMS